MAIKISILLLFGIYNLQGQPKKVAIRNGSIEPLIQEVDGKSAVELYRLTDEWINYNFYKATEVLSGSIENKMIRITGVTSSFSAFLWNKYDLEYSIRIDFKEHKYRVVVEHLSTNTKGRYSKINFKEYLTKEGEVKESNEKFVNKITNSLNVLNESLFQYITKQDSTFDDW